MRHTLVRVAGGLYRWRERVAGRWFDHLTVRSYLTASGDFEWSAFFDDRSGTGSFGFTGFVNELLARNGGLFVSGDVIGPAGAANVLVPHVFRALTSRMGRECP